MRIIITNKWTFIESSNICTSVHSMPVISQKVCQGAPQDHSSHHFTNLSYFLLCCLSSLFCFSLSVPPKHTESKPRPHITLPTVGTLYTVHTDEYPTAQANLMICILVLGQHRSLQNTQFHSLNYELFTLMGQL